MKVPYKMFIENPSKILLYYSIPEHLKENKDIVEMRVNDLQELELELRDKGSSLEEKTSSGVIWRMGFPGMILDTQEVYLDRNKEAHLHVVPIHPYRADLSYKQDKTFQRNVSPLTINAILIDRKGKIILGIRGGNVETGKLGVIPGGHIDYQIPLVEDVNQGLFKEFEEELGFKFNRGLHTLNLLGIMGNDDVQGVNILNSIKVEYSFEELIPYLEKAKDNFEHSSLISLTKKEVSEVANTGKLKKDNTQYVTTGFFQDCLKYSLGFI